MNVLDRGGQLYSLENCVWNVIRGREVASDIHEYYDELNDKMIYSFLLLNFGWIGDVDLQSEVIRWAGQARFYIWGFVLALVQRKYDARLEFKNDADEWE